MVLKRYCANGDGVQSIYIAISTEFSSLKHASSLTTVANKQILTFC